MENHSDTAQSQNRTIEYRCPHCKNTVEINEHLLGSTVDCPNPDCGRPFYVNPPSGEAVMDASETSDERGEADYALDELTEHDEEEIMAVHPSMGRRHPFRFIGLSLLILGGLALIIMAYLLGNPVFDLELAMQGILGLILIGVGAAAFLIWWVSVKFVTLRVTNKRTIYREGILAREISEIRHQDVRNLQVQQDHFERIMSIGHIGISSAGQEDIEIEARDLPHPEKIADVIREFQ